jgi:hypothetical protein
MTGRLLPALIITTALIAGAPPVASAQATIQILNADDPGIGFNDPTPADPIGGNTGTTVGEQRLNAFQHAANIWGQTLTSPITIRIVAFFDALACTANAGTLGGAAPYRSIRDFPGMPGAPGLEPGTWYPIALAEKRTAFPVSETFFPNDPFQAFAVFNMNLGQPGCLQNSGWYYGLDTNTPLSRINMVTVLLHEFAHGLGFTVGTTSANTGARSGGFPSVWEARMRDQSLGKTWLAMTQQERMLSARNTNNLVWQGAQTTASIPETLGPGTELFLQGNPVSAGLYQAEPAAFGARIPADGLPGILTLARDTGGTSDTDGCEPIISDVAGRIALVDRGGCTFLVKALNAQNAGAIGVVVANSSPGLFALGGADPSVVIPVVGITQEAGNAIRISPALSNTVDGGVPARLRPSTTFRAGTTGGFARLYAPSTFVQGSSVSHFDVTMMPNMLMEPAITRSLTHAVVPPADLTFRLLLDIGW